MDQSDLDEIRQQVNAGRRKRQEQHETLSGGQLFGCLGITILLLVWCVLLPVVGGLYLCGYLP